MQGRYIWDFGRETVNPRKTPPNPFKPTQAAKKKDKDGKAGEDDGKPKPVAFGCEAPGPPENLTLPCALIGIPDARGCLFLGGSGGDIGDIRVRPVLGEDAHRCFGIYTQPGGSFTEV